MASEARLFDRSAMSLAVPTGKIPAQT